MNKNDYTDEERIELNAIAAVLKKYKPVFKYSPNITQGMVVIYWNLLKEYNYNANNLNDVFNSISKRIGYFPSLSEVRVEMSNYVDGSKKFSSEKTYSVISENRVNECLLNRELIFRRYLSCGLHYVIKSDELSEYLEKVKNSITTNRIFYEVAYCRLYQMGIKDLIKPQMTIPKIWRFCGIVKVDRGDMTLNDALRIVKPKKI